MALLESDSGGLPRQPAALIGRADELATVRGQVVAGDVRLLTVVGPGGVGKTRLAIAVAESLRDDAAFPTYGLWISRGCPSRRW
jgi:DNA helicase TIP49 (TBP-interacting protein)